MKSIFLVIMVLLTSTEYMDHYIDNQLFKKGTVSFAYGENENSDVPQALIEQLTQALEQDLLEEFLIQNEAEYRIIPIAEQQLYAERERTGMLKEYQEKDAGENDIWHVRGEKVKMYILSNGMIKFI